MAAAPPRIIPGDINVYYDKMASYAKIQRAAHGQLSAAELWQSAENEGGFGPPSGRDVAAYAEHRGNIGPEGLGWQRPADESALSTAELVETRAYARSLRTDDAEEVIRACATSVRRYGFCVVGASHEPS